MRKQPLSTPDGMKYLPFAENKLRQLESLRTELRAPFLMKFFVVERFTIQVFAAGASSFIRILGGGTNGFIITPRFGSIDSADFTKMNSTPYDQIPVAEAHKVLSGYALKDGERLAIEGADAAFPLTDDDYQNVRRILSRDDTEWSQENEPPYLAGNIDWIGVNTAGEGEDSNAPVLTWKGPPGRHIPLDAMMYIPGLTVLDETVGDTEYYTPFGPNIYQGGAVLDTLPVIGVTTPKVLGAALCDEVLVVVAGMNYRDVENPDGGTGGFYDEVWLNDGTWRRIGWKSGSRPYLPWFFNQSGTAATSQAGLFEIDVKKGVVRYVEHVNAGSGTVTEKREPDYSVVKSGSWRRFYEYRGDELVYATIQLTSTDASTHDSDSDSEETTVPYKIQAPADRVITIRGDRIPSVGSTYSANGGCCGTWSGEGLTLDQTGKVTAITGCGCGKVIYTDKDGVTAQYAVKLPGVWVEISYENCPDCSLYGSLCTVGDADGQWDPLVTYDDGGCAIQKISGTIACVNTGVPDCLDCPPAYPSQVVPNACAAWFECGANNPRWKGKTVYEWRCP